MSYVEFKKWADKRGLTRAQKDAVILAATRRGKDISAMDEDEWEEIAEELGYVYGILKRVWGWIKGIF